MVLLELRDVTKAYRSPDGDMQAVLDVPSLDLEAGQQVVLAGSSGSGKTTLLNVIAGLLKPDGGTVKVDGRAINKLSEAARDAWRARELGYVFQSFHLLGGYSALENVLLGMTFGPGPDRAFARELLEKLEMGHRLNHRPNQLSIGQQQRVALARALANRPRIVLADEPTGNLDPRHAMEALGLLRGLCEEVGAALLVVSHDTAVLDSFDTRLDLAVLSLYVMLSILLSILVCAAASLFCACLVSVQVSAPYVIAGSTQELYTCLFRQMARLTLKISQCLAYAAQLAMILRCICLSWFFSLRL